MLVVSLTSIPPRFAQLPRVIAALLAQRRPPDRILLALPRRYRRFPGAHAPPDLPAPVECLTLDDDIGPAAKVLPAARHLAGTGCDLIYCDDDWHFRPDWSATLLDARTNPDQAVAASGFSVARLGRHGTAAPGHVDIAHGFSGVLTRPAMFDSMAQSLPPVAWAVDDIWLSGHLARRGIPIALAPGARAACTPLGSPGNLQSAVIDGKTRDAANRACAAWLADRHGIWPRL